MGDDIFHFAGQFQHDDAQGDFHAGYPGEERGRTDHGQYTWRDTRDDLADEAAEEGPGAESGDDDGRGNLAAKSDDGQNELGQRAVNEPADVLGLGGLILMLADPGSSVTAAVLEQSLDDHVTGFTGHRVRELEQACCEHDKKDFENWMALDGGNLANTFRP